MRSKLLVSQVLLAVVVGLLLVTGPAPANAGIARCEVTASEPYQTAPVDVEAGVGGYMSCQPAILPDSFNFAVCLQVKRGDRFIDIHCCRLFKVRVSGTPWTICVEPGRLLTGTHKYRTRARAVRLSTSTAETDYSPATTFTE